MSLEDLALFGRLHPLVLHFPIGFLFAALVLEVLVARDKVARSAQGVLLWCAALSAVVSAAAGWVLSHEEGYGGELLERHERLGIAIAVLAVLAALVHAPRARSSARLGVYRTLLVATCVLLVPAGHLGSQLTHGADWLEGPATPAPGTPAPATPAPGTPGSSLALGTPGSSPALGPPGSSLAPGQPSKEPGWSPALPGAPDTYAAVIAPILAARCSRCHGPDKHKGGLRLHTPEGLRAGSEDGPVLVPGDPAASAMLVRAKLPLDHEDHMPPEGKPQPAPEELLALETWIAAGAPFTGHVDLGVTPVLPPPSASVAVAGDEPEPGPPAETLAALDQALIHHERVAPGSPALWVDVAAVAPAIGDDELRRLILPLGPWVGELSLARSAITDAALAEVARFPELHRLDLRDSGVTDAGLAHLAGHALLAELVLARTKLTDASVEVLLGLPALRKVALWSSGVGPDGLARLRAARPELVVNAGDEPFAAELEREGELAFTSDRPLPGADALPAALTPVNTQCPVSGSPVNPKYAVIHDGRVVGFCCPNCPKEFWADPARFAGKLP